MIQTEHDPKLDLVRIVWEDIKQPLLRAKVRPPSLSAALSPASQ